jgi:hypothetical protein
VPTHWTYGDFEPDDDLAQGDILHRTDALAELLARFFPHFKREKYLAFLVVTQTCDLVQRSSGCKAPYINLAVVRSLSSILCLLLDEVSRTGIPGVYETEMQGRAKDLLARILNQNEQALGLFYLHPDLDAGISEQSVAMLRVTLSLKAEHYELFREARRGRLDARFGNELGWLSGNLYSRVATPD